MIEASPTCSACGFTVENFARTFRLGCSHCYEVFGASLETMLPRLHHGTTHEGKKPDLPEKLRRELAEIETL